MKRVPFDLEEKESKDIDNEVILSFCVLSAYEP